MQQADHDATIASYSRRGLSPAMTLLLLGVVGISSTVVLFGLADAMAPSPPRAEIDRSIPTVPELASPDGSEVVAAVNDEEEAEAIEVPSAEAEEAAADPAHAAPSPVVRHAPRGGRARPAATEAPAPAPGGRGRGLGRLTDDPLQDVDFGDGAEGLHGA